MNLVSALTAALYESPQKAITYTWLTSLVLLFSTFLVMCVAVSHMNAGHHDRVTAFAGAWSTLLFIIISIVGTYFMSHFKSSYSIGIFAGVIFVMSNQMLFVFAMFVERVNDKDEKDDDEKEADSSEGAMAVYAVFGTLLFLFRDKLGENSSSLVANREEDRGSDVDAQQLEEDTARF